MNSSQKQLIAITLLVGAAAAGLLRLTSRRECWRRSEVVGAVGAALRRLLVFTAALVCLAATPTAYAMAGAILLGFPLAWGLRGIFPPS